MNSKIINLKLLDGTWCQTVIKYHYLSSEVLFDSWLRWFENEYDCVIIDYSI